MNLKRTKVILIALFAIVCIGIGLTEVNFQSVKEYNRDAKKIHRDLERDQKNEEQKAKEDSTQDNVGSTQDQDKEKEQEKTEENKGATTEEKNEKNKRETAGKKREETKKESKGEKSQKATKSKDKKSNIKKKTNNKNKGKTGDKKSGNKKNTGKNSTSKGESQKEEDDNKTTCTIEIRCDNLLDSGNKIDASLKKYIPKDGIILSKMKVQMEKGSTVYDVLKKVCVGMSIHLDAEYTPMYKTYYVRGIGHLYEKQGGDMSGWLYYVNGKKPDVGASSCEVCKGDHIQWRYTCNGKN